MEAQLHAGRLVREYQVLCHGWLTRHVSRLDWIQVPPNTIKYIFSSRPDVLASVLAAAETPLTLLRCDAI